MNKLTVMAALALATLVTFNANAAEKAKADKPADKPKAEGKERPAGVRAGGKIAEELNLTADQKPKVQAVMKDAAEKRKALRDDTTLTPEQRREKAKAIADETKAKMKEILTAEQLTKMEELQKNRPARGEGEGARKKGDAPAKAK